MKKAEEWKTRCELAMMGKVVPVNSNDEVQKMTDYIYEVMQPGLATTDCGFDDIVGDYINKYALNEVKYIVCNTQMGMPTITYLLANGEGEDEYPAPFEEDYGSGYPSAFCYVFNTDEEIFSEFGDCFFEKRADGFYHRVS